MPGGENADEMTMSDPTEWPPMTLIITKHQTFTFRVILQIFGTAERLQLLYTGWPHPLDDKLPPNGQG